MEGKKPKHYVNEFKDDEKEAPSSWIYKAFTPRFMKNIIEKKPFQKVARMSEEEVRLYQQKYEREIE